MFGFAEWDSPVSLLLEFLLSGAIIVAVMWLVRRVNARAEASRFNVPADDDNVAGHEGPGHETRAGEQGGAV